MTIHEIAAMKINDVEVIKFPIHHLAAGVIYDANRNHIMNIRGLARWQYHPDGPEGTERLINNLAIWICDTLNNAYGRDN